MDKFAQGEIKILICTNIVESGLDIQNANTIIVQDVHQFGLAQLYQVHPVLSMSRETNVFSFIEVFYSQFNYVASDLIAQRGCIHATESGKLPL